MPPCCPMTVPGNKGLGFPANVPSSFSFFSFQVRQTVQATSYSLDAGAVVAPVVALARQVTSHAALIPLGSCQSHVLGYPLRPYLEWRFRKATWTTVDRHSNGLHRASAFSAREAESISSSTAASFRHRCHLPLHVHVLSLPSRPCADPEAALLLGLGGLGRWMAPAPFRFPTIRQCSDS